jgi:hypothetical protein
MNRRRRRLWRRCARRSGQILRDGRLDDRGGGPAAGRLRRDAAHEPPSRRRTGGVMTKAVYPAATRGSTSSRGPDGSDLTAIKEIPSAGKNRNDQLRAVAPPSSSCCPTGSKLLRIQDLAPMGPCTTQAFQAPFACPIGDPVSRRSSMKPSLQTFIVVAALAFSPCHASAVTAQAAHFTHGAAEGGQVMTNRSELPIGG